MALVLAGVILHDERRGPESTPPRAEEAPTLQEAEG
jgi:hypothetical protein